jgi:hypothetical protein
LRLFDREVDQRERGDRLRLAVFEHLKVFLGQAANEVSLLIQHERVDFDVLHLRLEGGRGGLWSCRLRGGRLRCGRLWGLAGGQHRSGERGEQRGESDLEFHNLCPVCAIIPSRLPV